MKIGVAAGHSITLDNPERQFEWVRCYEAAVRLSALLFAEGHEVVAPGREIYELENDSALLAKIDLFNQAEVDVALELHLNAGGGDYSTCIYWDEGEAHSEKGQDLAIDICRHFKAGLPWRCIGAKGQSYFARSLAFLNKTTMPSTITEVAFKDNTEQREFFGHLSGHIAHAALLFAGVQRYAAVYDN